MAGDGVEPDGGDGVEPDGDAGDAGDARIRDFLFCDFRTSAPLFFFWHNRRSGFGSVISVTDVTIGAQIGGLGVTLAG